MLVRQELKTRLKITKLEFNSSVFELAPRMAFDTIYVISVNIAASHCAPNTHLPRQFIQRSLVRSNLRLDEVQDHERQAVRLDRAQIDASQVVPLAIDGADGSGRASAAIVAVAAVRMVSIRVAV